MVCSDHYYNHNYPVEHEKSIPQKWKCIMHPKILIVLTAVRLPSYILNPDPFPA